MVKILLFGILFMMIFMSVCAIYWWKKYGKTLFTQMTSMNKTVNFDMDVFKDFKIPNQWK